MNEFVVTGLSHKTAPMELRERCRRGEASVALPALKEHAREAAILDTCNRFEVYTVGVEGSASVAGWISRRVGLAVEEVTPHLYVRRGRNAAKHLFFVTSSLDSLVVGETQIRAQVKRAYAEAQECGTVGPGLHLLFQAALRVSKEIAETTGVGRGTVSVAGAAADLAERIFGELKDARAIVVGAGETAELILTHLTAHGVKEVKVFNRTPENARALADRFHGQGHSLEALDEHLAEADILLAAAGAEDFLVPLESVRRAIRRRRGRPMVLVDVAVPRGVEPGVGALDNVYRFDMDALSAVTTDALRHRRRDFLQCCTLIDAATLRLENEQRSRLAGKTIQDLESHYRAIGDAELKRLENRLPDLDEAQKEHLRQSIHRLVKKFLHIPVRALREGDSETGEAVKRAFTEAGPRSEDG